MIDIIENKPGITFLGVSDSPSRLRIFFLLLVVCFLKRHVAKRLFQVNNGWDNQHRRKKRSGTGCFITSKKRKEKKKILLTLTNLFSASIVGFNDLLIVSQAAVCMGARISHPGAGAGDQCFLLLLEQWAERFFLRHASTRKCRLPSPAILLNPSIPQARTLATPGWD